MKYPKERGEDKSNIIDDVANHTLLNISPTDGEISENKTYIVLYSLESCRGSDLTGSLEKVIREKIGTALKRNEKIPAIVK